jgi:hypothetical protein
MQVASTQINNKKNITIFKTNNNDNKQKQKQKRES